MKYEEFSKKFIDKLQGALASEEVELVRREVIKNNNIKKDGLAVKYPDMSVAPTLYLDDLYKGYVDGVALDDLLNKSISFLEYGLKSAPDAPDITADAAKERLYCVLVNAAENRSMLESTPHERLGDLAIVPRYKVGDDGSFLVTNDICRTLQMTSEEVMEIAWQNTENQNYKIQGLCDLMREFMIGDGVSEEYADEIAMMEPEKSPMWVLTNESKIDGAIAIASKKILSAAHEKLGEEYYILPSSRHEVILVPHNVVDDVEVLRNMVKEVNSVAVSAVDRLSDNVYMYDGRKLTIADAPTANINAAISEGISKVHSHGR